MRHDLPIRIEEGQGFTGAHRELGNKFRRADGVMIGANPVPGLARPAMAE
jgi:hypothetical protein